MSHHPKMAFVAPYVALNVVCIFNITQSLTRKATKQHSRKILYEKSKIESDPLIFLSLSILLLCCFVVICISICFLLRNSATLGATWPATKLTLLLLLLAIGNGGARDAITAWSPPLVLSRPSSMTGSEAKTLRGTPSPAQHAAHAALSAQGYAVAVSKGYEAAKAAITHYLENT